MQKTYQYHNNVLSIPASLLYEDWGVMSYKNYNVSCYRRKLVRTREGKGLGNEALLSYHDLPEHIKEICQQKLGKPEEVVTINLLEPYIVPDAKAAEFFANHRTPVGKALSKEKQIERTTNCCILNAIQMVFKTKGATARMFGKNKTKVWVNISDAVNQLSARWEHNLPSVAKRLKERYDRYLVEGYASFIHKGEGNQHTAKLRGEVADFILAFYSLPNKLTIPMVLDEYNKVRAERDWPTITEAAVYNFLFEPENERLWTLARHGKQTWANKFQHSLQRDKRSWFPNIYWAIDGTKLDWIHFEPDSTNKMGAKLRINVIFDIYSEKIIGWSFSETEDHTDHFRAVKMAVNHAEKRPYLFTYDNQSGHKSARMQELYSNIVAQNGGVHYPHPAYKKNNPVEQLFNRLQKQVINRFWYSDGQSITVKRDDNKPNLDFISENKHNLKTKEDLHRAWETAVNLWNSAEHPHHKGETRNDVYNHEMAMSEDLTYSEIMQYMWINETKGNTYRREGITLAIKNREYIFEVYNQDKTIDLEFRRKYLGKKFIVRYDPENLDVFVQLFEELPTGEKIFVANAEPKRMHIDIPVLMEDGDKQIWSIDHKVREEEYSRDLSDLEALIRRTGITPERLIESQELLVKFKGNLPKKEAVALDAEMDILHRI